MSEYWCLLLGLRRKICPGSTVRRRSAKCAVCVPADL